MKFLCLVCAGSVLLLLTGCSRPVANVGGVQEVDSAELEVIRAAHALDTPPDGAVGISEFRAQLTAAKQGETAGDGAVEVNDSVLSTDKMPVVLSARVGGTKIKDGPLAADFPWDTGKAHFVISDPSFEPAADEGHAHAHEDPDHDCPFCNKAKNELAKSMAYVRCLDENGDVLKIDARQLFELTGNEELVIEGQGRLTVGTLMIDAEKIYVRR